MKAILKKTIILPSLALLAAMAFTACSDWTQTESLEIKQPDIESENPELYARYLESLRTYKQSDHKLLYVSFDNSLKVPVSQAHHINIVPDSVDIISLMSPDNLTETELKDIAQTRTKGTKVIYTISYEQIEAMFVPMTPDPTPDPAPTAEEPEPTPDPSEFDKFLASQFDKQIQLCNTYNYDGITLKYLGRSTQTMTDAQKAAYFASQAIVLDKMTAWAAAHSSKMLIFEGYPKHLKEYTLLERCSYLIIPTEDVKSIFAMNQRVLNSLGAGIPDDKIIVGTIPFSLDAEDVDTGYFVDGTSALYSTAYWVATDDTKYTKAGVAIYGVQTDYYNQTSVYPYTRRAIDILNPSAKN